MGESDWQPVQSKKKGRKKNAGQGTPKPPQQNGPSQNKDLKLMTNLFELSTKLEVIYHYDVIIKSNLPQKNNTSNKNRSLGLKFKRKVFEKALENWSLFQGVQPAFDGNHNCYTSKELNITEENAQTEYRMDERNTFKFTIQPVKKYNGTCKIDLSPLQEAELKNVPQEIITALMVVLRHHLSLHSVPVSQGFFNRPQNPFCLKDGLEIWLGYFFSITAGKQLFLNFDIGNKLFYPFCNLREIKQLSLLKKAKVFTTHLGYEKTYTIQGFGPSAAQQTFEMEGKAISVYNYFRNKFPLLPVSPQETVVIVGTPKYPVYLPLGICTLSPNQTYDQILTQQQQASFTSRGAHPPNRRFELIHQSLAEFLTFNEGILKEFQIAIDEKTVCLTGQILKPPALQYKDKVEMPNRGTWKNQPFYKPAALDNWLVLSFNSSHIFKQKLSKFLETLENGAKQNGMRVASPQIKYCKKFNAPDIKEYFKPGFNMVLATVPATGNYKSSIKALGDSCGIPTTCIMEKNIMSKDSNFMFANNIIMNMNVKLLGANFILSKKTCPQILNDGHTLLMGADVNHAAASSSDPSVVALAWNMNAFLNCYDGVTKEQPSRCELIQDSKLLAMDCFRRYARRNPNLVPRRILFFRDGVGEGQYEAVQANEIPTVLQAFHEVFPSSSLPKLTFLVVLKRHNLRMVDQQEKENIPSGSALINSRVTRVREFVLCSHAGILGTSVPIKYAVLHDDNDLADGELCQIAFSLCHLMGCTRTISIPAVVHYAHHLALRGKEFFHGEEAF